MLQATLLFLPTSMLLEWVMPQYIPLVGGSINNKQKPSLAMQI